MSFRRLLPRPGTTRWHGSTLAFQRGSAVRHATPGTPDGVPPRRARSGSNIHARFECSASLLKVIITSTSILGDL